MPPTDQWYHIDCFEENKDGLHFNGNAEKFLQFFFSRYLKLKLFRFLNFDDLNKVDQTELKKTSSSTIVNRKRKNENGDVSEMKQSKIEEKNDLTNEQNETRQKQVSYMIWKSQTFEFLLFRNKVNYFRNIKFHVSLSYHTFE